MPVGNYDFQLEDRVRLVWAGLNSGLNNVTVKVYNVDDGSVLLNTTTLADRGNGLYSYLWTHGRTSKTYCVAYYSYPVLLNTVTDQQYFTIDNDDSLGFSETGKAF